MSTEAPSLPSQVLPDAGWERTPPTRVGFYWWKKNYQWEPILREVFKSAQHGLAVFSQRYDQIVPIAKVLGEWQIPEEAR